MATRSAAKADVAHLPLSRRHCFQSPLAASAFQSLRIGVALWENDEWYAVFSPLNITLFELSHGRASERHTYNRRCVARVLRERKTVFAQHAGWSDFFVPVGAAAANTTGLDRVQAVLISGPFATERPTTAAVLDRWRWLTGRHGHPSDPEFASYLSMALSTLTLEPDQVPGYRRLLECFASLLSGHGDATSLGAEARELTSELERARFVEWAWDVAREMVDERVARIWHTPQMSGAMARLGLKQLPQHVVVGLTSGRPDDPDVVGEVLRRDAFQRACVDLATQNRAVAGRIGEHGVMFLAGGRGGANADRVLLSLADRAALLARRRFGLTFHAGTSLSQRPAPLSVRFEQALAAAERALSEGLRLVQGQAATPPVTSSLRVLRRRLQSAEERPTTLASRFERYLEAVAVHCGYRMEPARAHLEAGFDQAAESLFATGILPEKSYLEMCEALDRSAQHAVTAHELFAAYRRAVADLVELAERPVESAQEASLRRAVTYVRQHFAEPITLPQTARVAGFAPAYFSLLFKRHQHVTFEHYVRQLRIEHAKELLSGTNLSAERVGQLSGYSRRSYFHRVFKEVVGVTPAEYRSSRPRPSPARALPQRPQSG